jgi:hypothetical protein
LNIALRFSSGIDATATVTADVQYGSDFASAGMNPNSVTPTFAYNNHPTVVSVNGALVVIVKVIPKLTLGIISTSIALVSIDFTATFAMRLDAKYVAALLKRLKKSPLFFFPFSLSWHCMCSVPWCPE